MAAVNRCHGGPPVVPRAHRPPPPPLERRRPRPVPPVMSSGPPTTAPLPPQPTAASPLRPVASASASAVVSLTAPRPENQRAANEYVETPFGGRSPDPQPPLAAHQLPPPPPTTHRRPAVAQQTTGRPVRLPLPLPPPPVTKQPSAATAVASFSKEGTCSAAARAMGGGGGTGRPSIVCPECQRCRCASCRQPRPLPERWICDNSCLLSADAVVDYASCLCCVKALFYHCGGGSEAGSGGQTCADSPCGCHPHRRAARWGCLGAVACALPCLWLYWPLRGGKRAVELCYARHSRTGCRCRRPPQQPPPLDTPEKRLLDSGSPDSLL